MARGAARGSTGARGSAMLRRMSHAIDPHAALTHGTMSAKDIDRLQLTDDVDEAVRVVTTYRHRTKESDAG